MRTVQKTYTLFNIAELEGEAVEKAYTDWLAKGQEYPYAAFNSNTLEAFCNLFRVACTYYRYDSQTYCYRFHTKYEESTEELSGIRLRTFIYNNFHYGLYSAVEQLQGQIASAKIPLSRMISPALYWVMTAFHARHQQPGRTESAGCRQQSRQAGHLRCGSRSVQLPYREVNQQEETAQIRRNHRRVTHDLHAWTG